MSKFSVEVKDSEGNVFVDVSEYTDFDKAIDAAVALGKSYDHGRRAIDQPEAFVFEHKPRSKMTLEYYEFFLKEEL